MPTLRTTGLPAPVPAPRLRVQVIGDSLVYGTYNELLDRLSDHDTTVRALPGRPLRDPWIREQIAAAVGSDIVVIATASNDNLAYGPAGDWPGYQALLGQVTAQLDGSCTVWVDVRDRVDERYSPATAATTNQVLRATVEPAGAVVVAWSDISRPHDSSDWFATDELHFEDDTGRHQAGAAAYAAAITDGVHTCAQRRSPLPVH
ncbi:MAG: SGNH/GDSL hydrolase family protein [Acidimicrobiales bacterium]|jgi:hypothetical protein|nr:SGNH/GDSL hydrolase family protein [Acidimicrobiales bacterium]